MEVTSHPAMTICLLEYFSVFLTALFKLILPFQKKSDAPFHSFSLKPTHLCCFPRSFLFFILLSLSLSTDSKYIPKCLATFDISAKKMQYLSVFIQFLVTPVPPNLFCSVDLRNRLCNGKCHFKLCSCIALNSWKAISVQQHCHHVILKTRQMRLNDSTD